VQDQPSESAGGSVDPATLIIRALKNNYLVEAITEEATSSDGKKLAGFQFTVENGRKIKVFAEADTGIVRRVDGQTSQGGTSATLGGYKETGGVKFPSTIELKVNGQPLLSLTIDSVELNRAIDDAIFEKPKS
jgi:hypothetical protein